MVDDHTDQRLRRIEEKIDGFNEVLVTLARTDERMTAYMSASARLGGEVDQIWGELEKMRERIRAEEYRGRTQQVTITYGERLFWIIVAALPWASYLVGGSQ